MDAVTEEQRHRANVERSLRELQRMLADSEGALMELHSRVRPMNVSPAASLAVMRAGYEGATGADPFLPAPDSVLPALLALRKTQQVALEGETAQKDQTDRLAGVRRQLADEQARLADEEALGRALTARLAVVRGAAAQAPSSSPTAAQRRQERLTALAARRQQYTADTAVLLRALQRFIETRLGPLLAAEEAGGPVVGSLAMEEAEEYLASKTHKAHKGKDKIDDRQRRLDEMWVDGDRTDDQNKDQAGDGNKTTELQELTEQLLNALAEAGGDTSAVYVRLERESAAARFLVRSSVAQFHPRDATQLRLVDFGRELE